MIQALPGRERGGTARPRFCNPRPSTRPGRPSSGPPLGPWVSFRCSRCRSVAGVGHILVPAWDSPPAAAAGGTGIMRVPARGALLEEGPASFIMRGGAGSAPGIATSHEYTILFCTLLATVPRTGTNRTCAIVVEVPVSYRQVVVQRARQCVRAHRFPILISQTMSSYTRPARMYVRRIPQLRTCLLSLSLAAVGASARQACVCSNLCGFSL